MRPIYLAGIELPANIWALLKYQISLHRLHHLQARKFVMSDSDDPYGDGSMGSDGEGYDYDSGASSEPGDDDPRVEVEVSRERSVGRQKKWSRLDGAGQGPPQTGFPVPARAQCNRAASLPLPATLAFAARPQNAFVEGEGEAIRSEHQLSAPTRPAATPLRHWVLLWTCNVVMVAGSAPAGVSGAPANARHVLVPRLGAASGLQCRF